MAGFWKGHCPRTRFLTRMSSSARQCRIGLKQPDRPRRPIAVGPSMGRKGNAKNCVKGTLVYIDLLRQRQLGQRTNALSRQIFLLIGIFAIPACAATSEAPLTATATTTPARAATS